MSSALLGALDKVEPSGLVEGWCLSPQQPAGRRQVDLYVDGTKFWTICCDLYREDLDQPALGDGRHAFSEILPLAGFGAGRHVAALRDSESGEEIGRPLTFVADAPEAAESVPALPFERVALNLAGHIDDLAEDGTAVGWCCDLDRPDDPVMVNFVVDGEPVGQCLAALVRDDLAHLGSGAARHGFRYLLPWSVLRGKGRALVQIADARTSTPVPGSASVPRRLVATFDQRLLHLDRLNGQLNQRLRLLGERLDSLAQPKSPAMEEQPPASRSRSRRTPLMQDRPREPAATIIIETDAPIEALRDCLSALHGAGFDSRCDIVAAGRNAGAMAEMIGDDVTAFRFHQLPADIAYISYINAALRNCTAPVLVLMSAWTRVEAGWLDSMLETFAARPDSAILSSGLTTIDGMLKSNGLEFDSAGEVVPIDIARPRITLDQSGAYPVPAADTAAVAMHRNRIREGLNLDEKMDSLLGAMFDLSQRLSADGVLTCHQPRSVALYARSKAETAGAFDTALTDADRQRLRERWTWGSANRHV